MDILPFSPFILDFQNENVQRDEKTPLNSPSSAVKIARLDLNELIEKDFAPNQIHTTNGGFFLLLFFVNCVAKNTGVP